MGAIQFLQFTSAVTGLCVAIAMVRGFISSSKNLGNFHVDFVRSLTRIFLPLCLVASIVLVALGVPQTLNAYSVVQTVEGAAQTILVGPVASLVSIMQIGTNGGGYFGANAAHPFMNPSPISNLFEMFLMMILPTALIFVFGRMLGKTKESRPILIGAYGLFSVNLIIGFLQNLPSGTGIETRIGGLLLRFLDYYNHRFHHRFGKRLAISYEPSQCSFRLHGYANSSNTWRQRCRIDVHADVHNHHCFPCWADVGQNP